MVFIRIGMKSKSSYIKVTTQFNHHVLPSLIKMSQLSHHFLNPITTFRRKNWIGDESVHDLEMRNNSSSNCSKSTYTSPDNPPTL